MTVCPPGSFPAPLVLPAHSRVSDIFLRRRNGEQVHHTATPRLQADDVHSLTLPTRGTSIRSAAPAFERALCTPQLSAVDGHPEAPTIIGVAFLNRLKARKRLASVRLSSHGEPSGSAMKATLRFTKRTQRMRKTAAHEKTARTARECSHSNPVTLFGALRQVRMSAVSSFRLTHSRRLPYRFYASSSLTQRRIAHVNQSAELCSTLHQDAIGHLRRCSATTLKMRQW